MSCFTGKSVLVTGAAHGIGRASTLRFAAEGASVAVVDLRGELAEAAAGECAAAGGRRVALRADVSDPEEVAATVARVVEEFGGIDVVHSNAGRPTAGTVLR